MKPENLYKRVTKAESTLTEAVEIAEEQRKALIQSHRTAIKKKVKENIEETPVMREARENIERLQLRLELLRNIKMNWRSFQGSLTKKGMKMRINQHAHLDHLIAFLETGRGVSIAACDEVDLKPDPSRALMAHEVQPTGAGKTGAFAIDVALMDVPSLTLVPFDSLLDQTKKDMIKIGDLSDDQIGIVGGGSKEFGRKHTIATYAGHAAQMRKGGDYAKFMKTQCKLVICDEVHHQALGDRMQESLRDIETLSNGEPTEEEMEMLESEREVITHLSEQMGVKSLMIGFTATPRGAKKHVRQYFPQHLGRVYHREMVEAGLVVPYKIVQCDGSVYAGELDEYLNQEKEVEILQREGIYKKLVGEYADVLKTYRSAKHKVTDMPLRGMAFCTNHTECEKFAEEASEHGLNCRIVTGKEARGRAGQVVINEAVDALSKNEIDLIVTVEKLATGFNREEVNAIVSARITSAAKTIQYIGRGARSYTDEEGRTKEYCLVFETNWTLKKNAKRGKKPLRLADALAFNGEDPVGVCSMLNGDELEYENIYTEVGADGIVELHDGTQGITVNAYAETKGIEFGSLNRAIEEAGLKPVAKAKIWTHTVPVYSKVEVDSLPYTQKRENLLEATINNNGTVNLPDCIGVEVKAYARGKNLYDRTLKKKIDEAKLQPLGRIRAHPQPVLIYKKKEVDALPWVKQQTKILEEAVIDEKGTVLMPGNILGVVHNQYAKANNCSPSTLFEQITLAKLKPIGVVPTGSFKIPVYEKQQVDELQWMKERLNMPSIQDDGIVIMSGGTIGISVSKYAQENGLTSVSLQKAIEKAGLPIIGQARPKTGSSTAVYKKCDVDELSYVRRTKSEI